MYPFSIGVILDSFRTDIATALDKAQAVGAQGLQVYATKGEMSPEEMSAAKRLEFKKAVADHGLVIKNLVFVTLGTGVGGGVIIDGKIVAGIAGGGGELGHIHLNDEETETCGCRNKKLKKAKSILMK